MGLVPTSSQGSGGGGTVTSVTAGDTSIVIGGTAAAVTVETNTLDVIATDHPPAAAVAMNAQKITGLANGTLSTDAAAFGQIPTQTFYGRTGNYAGFFVPSSAPFCANVSAILSANRCYVLLFVCPVSQTITKIAYDVSIAATSNDNVDVGIFSATGGTLIASAGSTAGKLNGLGIQTVTLSAGAVLTAGTAYYAALACGPVGSTAASLISTSVLTTGGSITALFGTTNGTIAQSFQNTAFPLAASFVNAGAITSAPILALQQ